MASGAVESPIIAVLNIGEALIPCVWMLSIVHVQTMYNHPIDNLCLAISLGMESCGLSEFGVQHRPETEPKCIEELAVTIRDDK